MAIIVLYGAKATGKTVHAETFRRMLGARRIWDDWPHNCQPGRPRNGDLLITNLAPNQIMRRLQGGATLIAIDDARRRAGLKPAPKGGYFA